MQKHDGGNDNGVHADYDVDVVDDDDDDDDMSFLLLSWCCCGFKPSY